jgi:CBS domain-containing protein
MSIVLGGSFLGLGWAITSPEVLQAIFLYLGLINLVVAAFNLLPGFPLDGGRLLRAAIWAIRGDFVTATRDATRVATVIAVGLMVYGGYMALTGNLVGGLWLVFIGWIVIQASQASYAQTLTQERLKQVPIRRVMARLHGWVTPAAGLDETEAELAELRARCLPVGSDPEHYDGLICRSDISGLDDDRPGGRASASLTAADVMVDREHMPTIAASDPASEAWQAMTDQKVDRLAVVDDGKLVGFIDRRRLSRYLELHPGGQRPAA